jgi:hypothetical protein
MAIIQADRDLDDRFDLLLGTHKWSSFLKKPTKEEDKASNVFHCKYNMGRWVEEHGESF